MKVIGKILPVSALPTEGATLREQIRQLPFGEKETERLLSRGNPASLAESLAARIALAELLRLADLPASPILRTETGKPFFQNEAMPPFSLSHGGGLALAVLGDGKGSVGADLELFQRSRRTEAILRRYFSPAQQKNWQNAADRDREFLRLWTEKEAMAKCEGTGLPSLLDPQDPTAYHPRSHLLRFGERWGVITLCATTPIREIQWYTDQKEITVYE